MNTKFLTSESYKIFKDILDNYFTCIFLIEHRNVRNVRHILIGYNGPVKHVIGSNISLLSSLFVAIFFVFHNTDWGNRWILVNHGRKKSKITNALGFFVSTNFIYLKNTCFTIYCNIMVVVTKLKLLNCETCVFELSNFHETRKTRNLLLLATDLCSSPLSNCSSSTLLNAPPDLFYWFSESFSLPLITTHKM